MWHGHLLVPNRACTAPSCMPSPAPTPTHGSLITTANRFPPRGSEAAGWLWPGFAIRAAPLTRSSLA
jgi:hypothetical protein